MSTYWALLWNYFVFIEWDVNLLTWCVRLMTKASLKNWFACNYVWSLLRFSNTDWTLKLLKALKSTREEKYFSGMFYGWVCSLHLEVGLIAIKRHNKNVHFNPTNVASVCRDNTDYMSTLAVSTKLWKIVICRMRIQIHTNCCMSSEFLFGSKIERIFFPLETFLFTITCHAND